MKLGELARRVGAETEAGPCGALDREVGGIYAGDVISDLLTVASDTTLLITHLVGPQLLRVAELIDLPAVCIVNNRRPEASVARGAAERGILVLVSPLSMFETCGRLYACVCEPCRAQP